MVNYVWEGFLWSRLWFLPVLSHQFCAVTDCTVHHAWLGCHRDQKPGRKDSNVPSSFQIPRRHKAAIGHSTSLWHTLKQGWAIIWKMHRRPIDIQADQRIKKKKHILVLENKSMKMVTCSCSLMKTCVPVLPTRLCWISLSRNFSTGISLLSTKNFW